MLEALKNGITPYIRKLPKRDAPWLTEDLIRQAIEVCHKHGVNFLAVCGSVSTGHARPDSDVDILYITADCDAYLDREAFAEELSPVFWGRKVDVACADRVQNPYIAESMLESLVQVLDERYE